MDFEKLNRDLEVPEKKSTPEMTARDAMLENGNSVKTVLFPESGSGFLSSSDSHDISEKWEMLLAEHPEAVLSCEGKTEEEAREILLPLTETKH